MEVSSYTATIKSINYLDMKIYDFGFARLDRKWHGENSVMPTNRLYLPKNGTAFIGTGAQKINMLPGMAYLVPTGTSIDYRCDTSMDKLYLHFNLFRPDRYDVLAGSTEILALPFSADRFECLCLHAASGSIADSFLVKNMLYDVLAQFQSKYSLINERIPIYSKIVMSTITYIQENLSASLLLDELAKHSFISRNTLAEQFRKEVGTSLGKYIDDQLIAESQRQLSQTNRSIGDISNSLGYSNQCYFSRRFKQICNMTPQQYRIKNRI